MPQSRRRQAGKLPRLDGAAADLAAKGGDTAEIIARGDLDGDGKISTSTLDVQIDRKHDSEMMMAPTLRETDVEEREARDVGRIVPNCRLED